MSTATPTVIPDSLDQSANVFCQKNEFSYKSYSLAL